MLGEEEVVGTPRVETRPRECGTSRLGVTSPYGPNRGGPYVTDRVTPLPFLLLLSEVREGIFPLLDLGRCSLVDFGIIVTGPV